MSDAGINSGKYLGSGLGSFDVNTKTAALKGTQSASEAMATAKGTKGAELEIIDSSGAATVHSISVKEGTFTKPKATASGLVTIDNLSSATKVDKTKPLAIDPNIAGKFGGSVAILIDENNKTEIIGEERNSAVDKFLTNPTAKKMDAAYNIAGDDNFVNKRVAGNSLNQLSANYRDASAASRDTGLLKDGQVKTTMNGLIAELNNLSSGTGNLEAQRKARDSKFNSDIAQPQSRLNGANQAWDSANAAEGQKVNAASENLREARYPGVHDTESSLTGAQNLVADGKNYVQKLSNNVSGATSEVNRLETLKSSTQNLSAATANLETQKSQTTLNFASYLVNRKDQLVDIKAVLLNKANYYQTLADQEDRKPSAPPPSAGGSAPTGGMTRADADRIAAQVSGGDGWVSKDELKANGLSYLAENGPTRDKIAGTDNKISTQEFSDGLLLGTIPWKTAGSTGSGSVTDDPFAKTGSGSKPSVTDDSFAKTGSGNKPSVTDDPFSKGSGSANGAQYRNSNVVQDFRKRAGETKADANSVDLRIQSIDRVISAARRSPDGLSSDNLRYAINTMNDYSYSSYSYVFNNTDNAYLYFTEQNSDKNAVINSFVKPYDDIQRNINSNNQTIKNNVNEYKTKIDGANENLDKAKETLKTASNNLSNAQSNVSGLSEKLQMINNRPALPDTDPTVKPAKSAMVKAQKHMEDTVGDNAPLTKEKTTAQGIVDDINSSHQNDVRDLNGKITANANQAQSLINTAKRNLGI